MTTVREHKQAETGAAIAARLTSDQVWRALTRASFAVVSYVTPAGEPRSSGVVYAADGRRLYVAVAAGRVRRGGLLALLFPIPPATISFHGAAVVHPAGPVAGHAVPERFASLLPPERQASSCLLEIVPEGQFLVYGLGVSLTRMRSPAAARARVPVGTRERG